MNKYYFQHNTENGVDTKYKIHPYCDICTKDFQNVVDNLLEENRELKEDNDILCDRIDELINVLNNIYDLTHTSQDRHDIFVLVDEVLKGATK